MKVLRTFTMALGTLGRLMGLKARNYPTDLTSRFPSAKKLYFPNYYRNTQGGKHIFEWRRPWAQ